MNKQLHRALNKARHMPLAKENFLGIIVMLILSKDTFSTNFAVSEFIKRTFSVSFLNYAVRSRTLMCAKICRHINNLDDIDLKKAWDNFLDMIPHIENDDLIMNENTLTTKTKNKHAIRNMNKWISIIKKDNK